MTKATDYGRPAAGHPSLADYPHAAGVPGVADHEGRKYLRRIDPADGTGDPILVDVYAVLTAFGVTCPAVGHAVKKLLAAGRRGKGSAADDLRGALAAVSRAVELEAGRGATR